MVAKNSMSTFQCEFNRIRCFLRGHPGLFFIDFRSFSNNYQYNFYNKLMWKCQSRIWFWDWNPRPSEQEYPPITTGPGLPPEFLGILSRICTFNLCKASNGWKRIFAERVRRRRLRRSISFRSITSESNEAAAASCKIDWLLPPACPCTSLKADFAYDTKNDWTVGLWLV